MRTDLRRTWPLAMVLTFFIVAPAAGQASLGISAGGSIDDDLTPGLDQASTPEPGWMAGLQAEYWLPRSALGLRLAGRYADRELESGLGSYHLMTVEGGPMVRFPFTDFLAPYVAVVGGATLYAARDGSPTLGGGLFGSDPVERYHVAISAGTDLGLTGRLNASVEVGQRVTMLFAGDSPAYEGVPLAHTIFGLVGLKVMLGRGVDRLPTPAPSPAAIEREPEVAGPAASEPAGPAVAEPAGAVHYTLQLGGFFDSATAELRAEQARALGLPAWVTLGKVAGVPTARVRVGAASSIASAGEVAAALEQRLGWRMTPEPIGPDEAVPADAAEKTRAFLADLLERQPQR